MERIASRGFLKVVAKTLRLMEAMGCSGAESRLTALAKTLGMPKATVYRILFTLEDLGYVRQDHGKGAYALTEKAGWLRSDQFRASLKSVARPFMERLLSRFEQTVNLGVLDHDQVLYVEILEGLRSIRMAATVNTYAPLHCTAIGKSILANLGSEEIHAILKRRPLTRYTANTIISQARLMSHLQTVRVRGYAVDNEEVERGARCVAAPILNSEGKPSAAISVSGPVSHIQKSAVKEIAEAVMQSCARISERMGSTGMPAGRALETGPSDAGRLEKTHGDVVPKWR